MAGARIVIIGNEVLSGDVADQNVHFLAGRLTGLGTRVRSVRIVPDDDEVIVAALHEGLAAGEPVLVTGGIGPTHDDRTRAAVARALNEPLALHAEAAERLRRGYGAAITEAELGMALMPASARLMVGPKTGVLGFVAGSIYVFPGVPWLLADVFEAVAGEFRACPDCRVEIHTRVKEGDFADALGAVAAEHGDIDIGSYPSYAPDGWSVRLVVRGADPARVEAAAAAVRRVTRGE